MVVLICVLVTSPNYSQLNGPKIPIPKPGTSVETGLSQQTQPDKAQGRDPQNSRLEPVTSAGPGTKP